uniref:Cytochrome P450 CYP86K1 n=1 Tax=Picea glauca TaxID=3330 RepID=A0A0G7ZNY9_PICGL
METYSYGFITALMVVVAIIWHLTKSRKNKGDPVNWPVVGMVPSLLWNLSNAYEWAAGIVIRNGGTFAFKGPLGSNHFFEIVTSSPRNLEYILKDDFVNFPRGSSFKSVFFDIFGDGLFVADDEPWKKQRKAVAIAMSSTSFRDQSINQIQGLVLERLIPVLEESCKKKSSLDIQDIFLRLNFDMICLAIAGKDTGFLLPDLPEVPFARAFDEAIESCTYRLIIPPFVSKVMKFLNVGFERKHRRAMGIILEYASELVSFKIAELKKMSNEKRAQCGDILSTFIHLETQEGRSPSLKSVRDLCLSIILAARDTSSLALSWFFWLLNQHPDVETKIMSELYEILKAKFSNNPYDINTLRFSHDDLKDMQYLHAALSEAMRLYPPVPVSYRQAVRDVFLPDGTHVNKGSKLLYFIYATNRMESVWGKDCMEFKPERWINRDGNCMKESDYKYPVFNAGPRLCLGRETAYFNMKCVAAHVLLRYRMIIDPEHPVKPKFGLTIFMEHGLRVTLLPKEEVVPPQN